MLPVESTMMTHIGYDETHQILFIHFRNRRNTMHVMFDVPADVWEAFQAAESKGHFFNEFLKDAYDNAVAVISWPGALI